jgi:anaerobic magnesium-protoporphyrin IX monomethyl ester cyclase
VATILLIVPSAQTFYGQPRYPLLGISMIGAVLMKAGHTVRAVDMRLNPAGQDSVSNTVKEFKPDMVGFSVTNWDFLSAIACARAIKKDFPNTRIVFGGPQPTLCPNETVSHPEVDFVVRGEGEITVVELVDAILAQGDLRKVGGILYKATDGSITATPARPLISDLSTLPRPAFALFDLSRYAAGKERRLGIYSTRGCPYGCTFCTGKSLMGRKIRCRNPGEVVAEMSYWHKTEGITHFCFLEDNCFGKHGHGDELLDLLEKERLPVTYSLEVGVRADALTDELCRKLKATGCTIIAIGIESIDPEVLALAKKGETIEEITAGIRAAKRVGLFIKGYFIVGLPGDSAEKVKKAIAFAETEEIDLPRFALAQAFPYTELAAWVKENGHFYYDPYDYVLNHTDEFHGDVHFDFPGFSKKEIWKAYRSAHDRAEAIAFNRSLVKVFGKTAAKILGVFNNRMTRRAVIWLYQRKIVSLPF